MNPNHFNQANPGSTRPAGIHGLQQYYGAPESEFPIQEVLNSSLTTADRDEYKHLRTRDNVDEYD